MKCCVFHFFSQHSEYLMVLEVYVFNKYLMVWEKKAHKNKLHISKCIHYSWNLRTEEYFNTYTNIKR